MKLFALSLPGACLAIAARESRLLDPRRMAAITYPENCTPEQKPDDEIFCVTATIGGSGGFGLDLLVNIFDAEETSKSAHLNLQVSLDGSTPTGLNITGGGCANVFNEGIDGILEGTVGLCFEALPEGTGKLNPDTGYWNASVGASADGAATVFGKDISLSISDTIDAHLGPDFDLGLLISLEKTTGDDKRLGLGVGLDLSLNTQNNSILSYKLAATASLRGWLHPLFDEKVERELFNREFQVPLR